MRKLISFIRNSPIFRTGLGTLNMSDITGCSATDTCSVTAVAQTMRQSGDSNELAVCRKINDDCTSYNIKNVNVDTEVNQALSKRALKRVSTNFFIALKGFTSRLNFELVVLYIV